METGGLGLGIKGTVKQDFRHLVFFHNSNQSGPLIIDQWVKIFSIFVKISLSYSNFSIEKTDSLQYGGRLAPRAV